MLYRVHLTMSVVRSHTLVVIGTDCIGSCNRTNYHTITTTTAPVLEKAIHEDGVDIYINKITKSRQQKRSLLLVSSARAFI